MSNILHMCCFWSQFNSPSTNKKDFFDGERFFFPHFLPKQKGQNCPIFSNPSKSMQTQPLLQPEK
jgi:hypothetical protein